MVMDSRKAVGEEGFEWGADLIEVEIRKRIGHDRGDRGGGVGSGLGSWKIAAGRHGARWLPPRQP